MQTHETFYRTAKSFMMVETRFSSPRGAPHAGQLRRDG
jgi:hypothetical protein